MTETIAIPGVHSVRAIRKGDVLTIERIYVRVPNPARAWWQFWKPRFVNSPKLQTFTVID